MRIMALDLDCSWAAAVFAFIYTIINGLLFFTSVYTLFKFCKDYKVNIKKRPPKSLFYPGLIFFIFSSLALLATVRNSMAICFHGDINYMDFMYWIYFIVFYGAQTYLLWLVLFMRLHYVFNGSHYALSKLTVRIHMVIFIFIPFAIPFYFITLWMVKGAVYTAILLISFIFIIGFSCSLSALFIYKLFQVFKNMEIPNDSHIQSRKKLKNNKLLSTITKSTMLAVISLSMTLLTPITLLFGYYAVAHSTNEIYAEAGACLLAFCSLFDVYTNFLCILLSYSCFDKTYTKLCGKCDIKCRIFCIEKIMKKKSTKSGHIEISLMSKTSQETQETHFTSITPPNGGDGIHGSARGKHDYEPVEDTDYDETTYTETTRDINTLPTPYTQEHTGNLEYNIPEEDEYEFEDEHGYDENDTFKQDEGHNIYTMHTQDGNVVLKGGVLHEL